MMLRFAFSLVAAVVLCTTASAADVEHGGKVFKKCASCHMVGDKARKRTGPPLNNIIGAKASGFIGYKYSPAMKKAADNGLHWDEETLSAYLENPKSFMPGTKMSFRGLKSETDRKDVIAFLATYSGGEIAKGVDQNFVVSEEILAIEGDAEYGEYLGSECTTCHQTSGANDGIPSIVGWENEPFVVAMHAYRQKHRDNEVMQLVAGRLNDEEIAALAAYFKGLSE